MLICPRCRRTPPVQADPIPVIDTTVPVKRRADRTPAIITGLSIVLLLLLAVLFSKFPTFSVFSADHAAVNAWLRHNTPSGTWTEIEWHPAVDVRFRKQVHRICGIKVRTANEEGAATVEKYLFEIIDGKAVRDYEPSHWGHLTPSVTD
jgi:hypothetical protein